jgi:hypothetical protein
VDGGGGGGGGQLRLGFEMGGEEQKRRGDVVQF